jgi:hypothetical protein
LSVNEIPYRACRACWKSSDSAGPPADKIRPSIMTNFWTGSLINTGSFAAGL